MTASDVAQVLGHPVSFEVAHDGVRPERAAMKGELLVLSQQRSGIGRSTAALADTIERLQPVRLPPTQHALPARPGWFGYNLGQPLAAPSKLA
jgi:hypothetical protein